MVALTALDAATEACSRVCLNEQDDYVQELIEPKPLTLVP